MLHHASLEVSRGDADAEVAFWALLGYAEVPPMTADLAARARWVQDAGDPSPGACQVHLVYADEPVIPREAHLALVRPDYAAVLARVRAASHEVSERTRYWGSPRAFVRSPAGHRVEVMEFAPGLGAGVGPAPAALGGLRAPSRLPATNVVRHGL